MQTVQRLALYMVVGVLNTAVHYLIFIALINWTATPILVASTVGYLVGTINSYLLNRTWTFRQQRPPSIPEFVRFCIVNGASLVVNLAVLQWLVSTTGAPPTLAQAIAIAASLGVNFVANLLWTFRGAPAPPTA
jgi:putative flippase GtrA